MRKYRVPVPPLPKKEYTITFIHQENNSTEKVVVTPQELPYGRHGLPGSLLDIASHIEETLIEHSCGGVQACSTCHIYVEEGLESCNEISEREEDYIEKSRGVTLESRLACCCVPNGTQNLRVTIPTWNVNEFKEG